MKADGKAALTGDAESFKVAGRESETVAVVYNCKMQDNLEIIINMENIVDHRKVTLENINPDDDKEDIEAYILDFINDSKKIMKTSEIAAKIVDFLNKAA